MKRDAAIVVAYALIIGLIIACMLITLLVLP